MTAPLDGWDQAWGYADPAQAAAAGRRVVSMYLSNDPSKNATSAKIRAYHAAGIGVILNWESEQGRPLLGGFAGQADAAAAVQQYRTLIAQVGYAPGNRPAVPFSCDTETNPGQYPVIDGYYRAAKTLCNGAGFGCGAYGSADLIDHLAGAGLIDMGWQTLAWSGGRISPNADFYQSSINDTLAGASVDFDRAFHPAALGAWWPPTHPLNTASPDVASLRPLTYPAASEEDDMYTLFQIPKGHPNEGAQYVVRPGHVAFHITSPGVLQSLVRVGQVSNPASPRPILQAEIDAYNVTTGKVSA